MLCFIMGKIDALHFRVRQNLKRYLPGLKQRDAAAAYRVEHVRDRRHGSCRFLGAPRVRGGGQRGDSQEEGDGRQAAVSM